MTEVEGEGHGEGGPPGELVFPVSGTHAVVIGHDQDVGVLGTVEATLDPEALARAAAALGPAMQGIITAAEGTGRLVRLSEMSARELATARRITESGGYVQATLRNADGSIRHVVRFKPANVTQLAAGAANVLGAIAAQAQLAAIQRDVARTLELVEGVHEFQHRELLASVAAAVRESDRLAALVAAGGGNERDLDAAAAIARELRAAGHALVHHLQPMLDGLERASRATSPRAIDDAFRRHGVARMGDYLRVAAASHAAAVRAEGIVCADLLRRDDPTASAHIAALRVDDDNLRVVVEDLFRHAGPAVAAIRARSASAATPQRPPAHGTHRMSVPVVNRQLDTPDVRDLLAPLGVATKRSMYRLRQQEAHGRVARVLDPLTATCLETAEILQTVRSLMDVLGTIVATADVRLDPAAPGTLDRDNGR